MALKPGQWGVQLHWPCGHSAYVLGEHDLWHEHYCPVCRPGERHPVCDVEYLDPHASWPQL